MTLSKKDYFSKYDELKWHEKVILNNFCYFPPKPRRVRGEIEIDVEKYKNIFKRAYNIKDLSELNNKSILDFGCGEGGFSVALAQELPGAKITGIDLLDGQDAANKVKEEKNLNNLNFILGKSEVLPDNSFDYVFSHDSFEHFEDPEYILSEMIRITKPNGHLLIKFGPTWASPYGRHMGGTYRKDRPWIHLVIPEKNMMRVHSVYHNKPVLLENYKDLDGGLNKMTIKKAFKFFKKFENLEIVEKRSTFVWKGKVFKSIPLLNEMFTDSLYVKLKVNKPG